MGVAPVLLFFGNACRYMMLEDLMNSMTEQQHVDVVEFLTTLKSERASQWLPARDSCQHGCALQVRILFRNGIGFDRQNLNFLLAGWRLEQLDTISIDSRSRTA